MRLDIRFHDRVGLAQEILAVLSGRGLYLMAVEVDPLHIYVDAPALGSGDLDAIRSALRQVRGFREVTEIDLLPGARQRLQLETLLAAMADPVLAVDAYGVVTAANAAAAAVAGASASELRGMPLGALFDAPGIAAELEASAFRPPVREVVVRGQPFLLDVTAVSDAPGGGGAPAGGVVTLHSPRRLGKRLHAIQTVSSGGGFDAILGVSPPLRALKARAARVAAVEAPLLICGETGTGKELVAYACHLASPRRDAPFLALNCAALPESLAESELFGYAPGAFTGAHRSGKPGLLEMADTGSVFLDEIGEMSPYLQAKLLRFLSDGRFRRVGGDRELHVDVRVVSATHRDLAAMVAEKAFREDLLYRLNVVNLDVPPLRERGDDVLLLAREFLARASAQVQRATPRLTPAAERALQRSQWPGNVRQLHNVLFRAVTVSDAAVLDVDDLELASGGAGAPAQDASSLREALARFERELLERLYPLYPSSRKLAAHLRTSHNMIAKRLRQYGISSAHAPRPRASPRAI